ncbi:FIST N-terminal domain-containing protein [Breznakiella homolactica]|uniref:FIST C-terminal domain-containing protein n=1 Tax=Breznakiella homolactica TaxID=2798577 RepID=A0A7T7XM59_9SPIR|nr:FIST N-terminal domain-containing protein [Breznakiella homolactica]QQO08813.1 FIST C-terminal domain-containing protein [Breznakiella homolactica]
MLRSFSACTDEIDDAERAVSDLIRGLDFEGNLLNNTVGILSCFAEFLETGIIEALQKTLPFDIIGTTTIANAAAGTLGETSLCLLVITSDDIEFSLGLSGPISGEDPETLKQAYRDASSGRESRPAFMFSFAPLLFNTGVDFFVENLDEISGGIPNFGTLAVDHNADYHDSQVIFRGQSWRDRCAVLLAYGDCVPDFYIGTISDEKVFPEKGAVTASQGNQLQSVNNKSVTDYLLSLGLTKNEEGSITGINSFPIIVDFNDGTEPVVRAMFALTPDGSAVCGGKIPVGSILSIGRFDADEIIDSSTAALNKALSKGREYSLLLAYSCIGRYFTLEYKQLAELELLVSRMKGRKTNYMMAYSGGEICPVRTRDGKTVNRSHNNSFVICAL